MYSSCLRNKLILKVGFTLIMGETRAHPRGGPGGARALPLGPKKHYIFSVSSLKFRDFRLCDAFSEAFCYVEGPRKPVAWQRAYVRFIFRTLLATIHENFCPGLPLEKILGAPLGETVAGHIT